MNTATRYAMLCTLILVTLLFIVGTAAAREIGDPSTTSTPSQLDVLLVDSARAKWHPTPARSVNQSYPNPDDEPVISYPNPTPTDYRHHILGD